MTASSSSSPSIFLVHPLETTRSGLALLAEANGFSILGSRPSLEQALSDIDDLRPDVVLLCSAKPPSSIADLIAAAALTSRIFVIAETLEAEMICGYLQFPIQGLCSAHANAAALFQALQRTTPGLWLDSEVTAVIRSVLVQSLQSLEGAPNHSPSFTDREQAILRMLIRGSTNSQIATQLGISVETVKTYIRRVMDKSGLRSRADLMTHYRTDVQKGSV